MSSHLCRTGHLFELQNRLGIGHKRVGGQMTKLNLGDIVSVDVPHLVLWAVILVREEDGMACVVPVDTVDCKGPYDFRAEFPVVRKPTDKPRRDWGTGGQYSILRCGHVVWVPLELTHITCDELRLRPDDLRQAQWLVARLARGKSGKVYCPRDEEEEEAQKYGDYEDEDETYEEQMATVKAATHALEAFVEASLSTHAP